MGSLSGFELNSTTITPQNPTDTKESNKNVLTNDEKSAIHQFGECCKGNVQKGRKILELLKPYNENGLDRLEIIFNDTEKKLEKLNKFLDDKNRTITKCETRAITGVSVAGGVTIGCAIGAAFCMFDAGLLAIVGGIIGGAVSKMINKDGVQLGPLLLDIIDNMNKIQKHVADAYGFQAEYTKQNL